MPDDRAGALMNAVKVAAPAAVYFDGAGGIGGVAVVRALDAAGLAAVPLIGTDPMLDGPDLPNGARPDHVRSERRRDAHAFAGLRTRRGIGKLVAPRDP